MAQVIRCSPSILDPRSSPLDSRVPTRYRTRLRAPLSSRSLQIFCAPSAPVGLMSSMASRSLTQQNKPQARRLQRARAAAALTFLWRLAVISPLGLTTQRNGPVTRFSLEGQFRSTTPRLRAGRSTMATGRCIQSTAGQKSRFIKTRQDSTRTLKRTIRAMAFYWQCRIPRASAHHLGIPRACSSGLLGLFALWPFPDLGPPLKEWRVTRAQGFFLVARMESGRSGAWGISVRSDSSERFASEWMGGA